MVKFCKVTGTSEFATGFIIVVITASIPEMSVIFFISTANVEITVGYIFGSNIKDIALMSSIFFLPS
ncbi:MAG: hypothetical protein DA328_06005 [Nitrososphaeraceae archaeon]|nr:hypothetical protein [Nitrososphaeraceae archaeon]